MGFALTDAAVFAYGAAGAAFGAVVVQTLPVGVALKRGEAQLAIKPGAVIGALLIVLCFAGLGGVVALGVSGAGSPTKAKTASEAIAYGLGFQGLVGGLLSAWV